MSTYKQNCTKGPVIHREGYAPHFQGTVMREEGQGETIALTYNDEHGANAELIAEAVNTLQETGFTPAELAGRVHEYREQLAAVRLTLYADLDQCGGNVQHHYTNHLKHREDLDRDAETGKFFPLSKYQPVTPA